MPFDAAHDELKAREKDGRLSEFCVYCYENGAFLNPDISMADMVEIGVPHLARKIGEDKARAELSELLPTLKRWNLKNDA